MSQLLRALGLAANSGDPSDMTDAQTGYAERGAKTGDAMAKFPANEAESAGNWAERAVRPRWLNRFRR